MKPNDSHRSAHDLTTEPTDLPALADIIAAFPSAAMVLTREYKLRAANAAARELLGIENTSAITTTAAQLFTAFRAVSSELEAVVQRAAPDTLPIHERVLNDRTGQWIDVRITACGPTMLLLYLGDTTERDRRLAAIGRLAAGVMHDVNNVLHPILGAAYLLQHHAESPAMVRDYAERIRQAAESGAATAARVGRFIRQEPLHNEVDVRIDLSRVVEGLLELIEPLLEQRTGTDTRVHVTRRLASQAYIRGIPGDIRDALLNVITNALDAMADTGGRLTVRTVRGDAEVAITIADTGDGMADTVRERAFEPFFTTKGAGGSGLGLAEVYGIVSRHHGSVNLESTEGHGTIVTLRFPADANAAEIPGPAPLPGTVQPLNILVVEDQEDGREFLLRALRLHGHAVDAVASAAAAQEKFALDAFLQYNLLLTDVGLPDGSGWDLAAAAKLRSPAIRIGVITGWEPTVRQSEVAHVEFILQKPLRVATLMSHIAGQSPPAQPE